MPARSNNCSMHRDATGSGTGRKRLVWLPAHASAGHAAAPRRSARTAVGRWTRRAVARLPSMAPDPSGTRAAPTEPVPTGQVPTDAVPTLADRLSRLAEQAVVSGADVILISPGPDLQYLVGHSVGSHERLTCLVVPATGEPSLLVPTLERPGWSGT